MTRETKIGVIVGLSVIFLIAVLISHYGKERAAIMRPVISLTVEEQRLARLPDLFRIFDEESVMRRPKSFEELKGQAIGLSYFLEGVDQNGKLVQKEGVHGYGRRWGEVSPEVRDQVVRKILQWAGRQKYSEAKTHYLLALAFVKSGFNPDAADPKSDTTGVFGIRYKNRAQLLGGTPDPFDIEGELEAMVGQLNIASSSVSPYITEPTLESGGDVYRYFQYHYVAYNFGVLTREHFEVLDGVRSGNVERQQALLNWSRHYSAYVLPIFRKVGVILQ